MNAGADAQPAENTAKKKRPGIVTIGKTLGKEITTDDVPGLAAEVAYHGIFAIPALIIVLFSIAAMIEAYSSVKLADRLTDAIANAPEETQDILNSLVDNAVGQVNSGLMSFALMIAVIVALWSGSNGVAVLMKAFNRAYDVEEARSFVKQKALAIGLTLLLGLAINLAFVLWVFGNKLGEWVANKADLDSAYETAWNLARYPIGFLFFVLILMVLYYVGPTIRVPFRGLWPGAFFATFLWLIVAGGFSIYMQFADPGSAYGALGSVIVFLFFLYLTSLVFLLGAEFNAVLVALGRGQISAETSEEEDTEQPEGLPAISDSPPGTAEAPSRLKALLPGALATIALVVVGLIGAAMSGDSDTS